MVDKPTKMSYYSFIETVEREIMKKLLINTASTAITLAVVLLFATGASAGNLKICINGQCNDGSTQQTHKRVTAKSGDALEIITYGEMITSGIGPQGQSQFVVKYLGQRYPNIRGRIFSCEVSKTADNFLCYSWPVLKN